MCRIPCVGGRYSQRVHGSKGYEIPGVVVLSVIVLQECGMCESIACRQAQVVDRHGLHRSLQTEAARTSRVAGDATVAADTRYLLVAAVDVEEGQVGSDAVLPQVGAETYLVVPALFGFVGDGLLYGGSVVRGHRSGKHASYGLGHTMCNRSVTHDIQYLGHVAVGHSRHCARAHLGLYQVREHLVVVAARAVASRDGEVGHEFVVGDIFQLKFGEKLCGRLAGVALDAERGRE